MSEGRAVPSSEKALGLLRRYFLCRTDTVAFLAPWERPSPAKADGQLDELLLAHLKGNEAPKVTVHYRNSRGEGVVKGHFRIGAYAPAPDGTTRWLCLDFDGGDHAEALADPTTTALAVYRIFESAGMRPYLERSGGGHGWHLWCFFDPPVSARKARALTRALLPEEVTLANGERAQPRTGRGIEVFPKQPKIGRNGFGNLVWLPWWSEANGAANQFHRPDDKGELVPFVPEEFETADESQLDAVIAKTKASSSEQPRASPQPAKPREATDEAWREWREKALAALPLEAVYGQWLTGKTCAGGWLQCRDPWSPTGDRDPSAGVADGSGQAERGEFHSFISGRSLSVFDFLIQQGQAADFRAACARVAELSAVPLPAPDSTQKRKRTGLPEIRLDNRQLRDVLAEAWQALHAANSPPVLFQRSGSLVRLQEIRDRKEPEAWEMVINLADQYALLGRLAEVADWVRMGREGLVNASPPREIAAVMAACVDPKLPVLAGIAATPFFNRRGRLVTEPGYHPEEAVWFQPAPGLSLPPIPEKPGSEEVAQAKSWLLEELLVDFPFETQSDRAHAVAAMLLPFVRPMIEGCTPLHLVEAPDIGTGKGLLCKLISVVATGDPGGSSTLSTQDDEARKMLTAELAKGRPIILLDNAKENYTINCPSLASILTTEVWRDRLLGQSDILVLPNRACWLLTGNNVRLSLEMARRSVRIRLNAGMERAWRRQRFKHEQILTWAREHRAELVWSVLVLVHAWLAAGRPMHPVRLGSFEHWSAVVGGILQVVEIPGFLASLEELYAAAEADRDEWRGFVAAWWEQWGEEPTRVADLNDLCDQRDLMLNARGDGTSRSQQVRLGRALQGARDRVFDGKRIVERRDPRRRNRLYGLVPTDEGDGKSVSPPREAESPDRFGSDSAIDSASEKQGNSSLFAGEAEYAESLTPSSRARGKGALINAPIAVPLSRARGGCPEDSADSAPPPITPQNALRTPDSASRISGQQIRHRFGIDSAPGGGESENDPIDLAQLPEDLEECDD